jgi:TonB family protein
MVHSIMGGLVLFLCSSLIAGSNIGKDRMAAASGLAKEIEHAQFQRVYVADFLDSSGGRNEKGCFFASVFSTNLAKRAHNFAVLNRIQAQKQLDGLQLSPQDLQRPELLSKAAQALGADAVLEGSASISPADARLFLSLRDVASGKEVHSMVYREDLEPAFEGNFPPTQSEGGRVYYFPGLDGISMPKCIHCPDPEYTDQARRDKVQGAVLISVTIDEKGTITGARVVKSPDDSLTKRSLDVLKKWRLEPSHDLDGKAVAVRTRLEITFKMLN